MFSILSYGLFAGLTTTLGALLVLVFGNPGQKRIAFYLGLAAGVMLAVVALDLIPTALRLGNWLDTLAGFLVGAGWLWLLDRRLLFKFGDTKQHRQAVYRRLGLLIAIGIALHDLPEGMAIALGYTAAEKLGPIIALAIGLHNIPEGMAMAAPLRVSGMRSSQIIILILMVSLITPLGTALGILVTQFSPSSYAGLLGLAAGCMLYLVIAELIPESRRSHHQLSGLGVLAGILIIWGINQWL